MERQNRVPKIRVLRYEDTEDISVSGFAIYGQNLGYRTDWVDPRLSYWTFMQEITWRNKTAFHSAAKLPSGTPAPLFNSTQNNGTW